MNYGGFKVPVKAKKKVKEERKDTETTEANSERPNPDHAEEMKNMAEIH